MPVLDCVNSPGFVVDLIRVSAAQRPALIETDLFRSVREHENVDDALEIELARYNRRLRRRRSVVVAVAVVGLLAGLAFYRTLNGYPGDHGLAELQANGEGYSPETWTCVVDIFENHRPLPGTLFGRFVVNPVYGDDNRFDGFVVEAAFSSEEFRIGDGQIYSYHFNEFYDWARLDDCA